MLTDKQYEGLDKLMEDSLNRLIFESMDLITFDETNDTATIDQLVECGQFEAWNKKEQKLRSKIKELLVGMEGLELGKFIPGRRGHPSRFVFALKIDPIEVLAHVYPNIDFETTDNEEEDEHEQLAETAIV